MSTLFLFVLVAAAALVALWAVTAGRRVPSSDRSWAPDHARSVRVEWARGAVILHDVRDFAWSGPTDFIERYRTERVEPDDVRAVWFILAPFARQWRGLAHNFVSFEFRGDRFLAVSAEARREAGEPYSLVRGLWRGFETIYVVGTEQDLVGLRALRGDPLYLYPTRATPREARALFIDMMRRAEALRHEPEFYHTVRNNCNTNLRDHVNTIAPGTLPRGPGILLPGYSDAVAIRHGLIGTPLGVSEARRRFRVDERARQLVGTGDDFGRLLREGLREPRG